MNNIIQITETHIQQQEVQTVNARELHEFLEVGKDFSTLIKKRIDQYNFEEDQDFVVFTQIGENLYGGRPSKEYHITIDMAKELSMVERNDRGKQARQYFIEKEREANDLMSKLNDPAFLRGKLDYYAQRLIETEAERDEAVRTKAHISDKKTALIMTKTAPLSLI